MNLSFVMVTIPLLIIPFGTRSLTTLHVDSNRVTGGTDIRDHGGPPDARRAGMGHFCILCMSS